MDEWWISLLVTVVIVFLWTLLIRVVPAILGTGITKRIEHQYDRKLEETKAVLQSSYSTLKTSVDFLSAAQPELRLKMIESVEKLWGAVLSHEEECSEIIFLDSILLPNEIDQNLRPGGNDKVYHIVQQYQDFSSVTEKMNRANKLSTGMERLFVGDRLWLIYDTIRRVYYRVGFLICKSIEQGQYIRWQNDSFFMSILDNVLPDNVIDKAKKKRLKDYEQLLPISKLNFLKKQPLSCPGLKHLQRPFRTYKRHCKTNSGKLLKSENC